MHELSYILYMTTYVYLNTYASGLMYVGSHTWEGPVGEIDPNYKGSSHVAKIYSIEPVDIKILEVVPDNRKFVAEKEWIVKYCTEYGIADEAKHWSKSKEWLSRFKEHGRMINLHANDVACALEASHAPEAVKKSFESRVKNGSFARQCELANSDESRKKATRTRIERHGRESWSKAVEAMKSEASQKKKSETMRKIGFRPVAATIASHTPEALAKNAASRKKHARKVEILGEVYDLKEGSIILGIGESTLYRLTREHKLEGSFVVKNVKVNIINETSTKR